MAKRLESYLMERREGVGDLYRGEEFLTSAAYYVELRREFTVVTAGLGSPVSRVEGPPVVTGMIEMTEPRKVVGERLTLHMEGGRRLDLLAVAALGRAGASVRGSGGFY
jgi:hypothetical protein